MGYNEAIRHLYARGVELAPRPGDDLSAPRRKFDLEHMRILAEGLGNPQKRFCSVLIAGTNGKGSTAATLAHILKCAGHKTGLYISPHLVRVNERINTGQASEPFASISDDAFAQAYFKVDDAANRLVAEGKLPHAPSFFEVMTAAAFVHFVEADIEIAVLEVGLGGRLDATNIVDPEISVITDISLDHTEWLGDTLTEIAREKAGILRDGGTMITLPQHPEANFAIGEIAVTRGVTGINAAEYMPRRGESPENHYRLQVRQEEVAVESLLHGEHQQRNLALAIASAVELDNRGISIPNRAIEEGIRTTTWPGRLQEMSVRGVPVLLDVAHNPAGAWTLRSYLSAQPTGPRTLLFSALSDKSIVEMMRILFPLFEDNGDRILLASINNPRAATLAQLAAAATEAGSSVIPFDSVRGAINDALAAGQPLIVTGSVYLVGEALSLLAEAQGNA